MLAMNSKQDEELEWIDRRVKRLLRQGKIGTKKIYIFGASMNTRKIIQVLGKHGMKPAGILDNDVKKLNSHCARIKVVAADQTIDSCGNDSIYIVGSPYWREMVAQLEDRNVNRNNILRFIPRKHTLIRHLYEAGQGKHIHSQLIRKYGNIPIFLCPYTGTGDIYLIGCFWRQYIERNGVEDYVFIVINGACKKTAMLFGIKNIELLKRKYYCSHLLNYYLLYPDRADITVLNDSWPHLHTNQIEWFRGYRGLNFTEMFRRYVFDLPIDVKPEHPILKKAEEELVPLFERYRLISGRTVILSPYSNTLADLSDDFWEKLVEKLKSKGYAVCTNSSGENEPAVSGTVPVFFPLDIAPQFVEKAGYFIGIRSGFCDIISSAKAKKIILYDAEERFYNSSSFEYFSLSSMELCKDAVEIQFKRDYSGLLELVMGNFCVWANEMKQ